MWGTVGVGRPEDRIDDSWCFIPRLICHHATVSESFSRWATIARDATDNMVTTYGEDFGFTRTIPITLHYYVSQMITGLRK